MLEVFSLRLAAGLVAALWVLPKDAVEPRFYRIHLVIALCLVGAAGAFGGAVESQVFWLAIGVGFGATLLAAWSYSVRELAVLRLPTTIVSVVASLTAASGISATD